jgi:hypothetical protein
MREGTADGSDRYGTVTSPVRKLAQFEPEETYPLVASRTTTNLTMPQRGAPRWASRNLFQRASSTSS